MLDESEFKPFSLTDFTAVESDPSENDDTSDGREKMLRDQKIAKSIKSKTD